MCSKNSVTVNATEWERTVRYLLPTNAALIVLQYGQNALNIRRQQDCPVLDNKNKVWLTGNDRRILQNHQHEDSATHGHWLPVRLCWLINQFLFITAVKNDVWRFSLLKWQPDEAVRDDATVFCFRYATSSLPYNDTSTSCHDPLIYTRLLKQI